MNIFSFAALILGKVDGSFCNANDAISAAVKHTLSCIKICLLYNKCIKMLDGLNRCIFSYAQVAVVIGSLDETKVKSSKNDDKINEEND